MNLHNQHVNHTNVAQNIEMVSTLPQLILLIPFLLGIIVYMLALIISFRKQKPWPLYRMSLWIIGNIAAIAAVAGPLAERSHMDFTAHMLGHLLLGMLAPLLMALAAPMTLLLRVLDVERARQLTKLLKSSYSRIITDPVVASVLNIGGLWLLYSTNVYSAMHQNIFLHIFIHMHVFLAGYVFTISMVYIDPIPHRTSYVYRSFILVLALAAHGILSKYIYIHSPAGVPQEQGQMGAMLMYYGGDAVDILLIFLLCLQWYKVYRPRVSFGNCDTKFN